MHCELTNRSEKETTAISSTQNQLIKSRSVIISGEINQPLAENVMTQLIILQEISNDPIKIFINSQGGHVEAGDTLHDMIKFIKPKVIMIGTGWVASAGITIFLAANKENRYSLPNTRFMIHQPLGGVQGRASDIEIEAKEIIKIRNRINRLISKATNQSLDKVAKDTDRNYWMEPEEARDYGIIGQIIHHWDELHEY
ncbi:ATP-dependent Clp protease proteolytic subunit [Xenorhabdus ehlersii]|uniref:ATP-dependent Clp protease proteolytic subunit n=1 Tax=Xenorhabdus ehlersii TaxID=290111 RepID=A0A2D0IL18_9GAMM|nr:ATP-dependent Clp protease proteolytic subunit [Xenorhabdus ehlersii]PHM22497.1 ATP-dependent Clp protease proteolytic subunit [Xenorhabdus ehlersii]RKE88674.1 ATP-dependent Clp protease protease subunit [Xenorhabdus ehlersii]